jgi:hypothetical protein
MIRRGARDDWLLISQVEHARIAAEMADAWGNEQVAPLPSQDLLIHAIRHHDDGWAEWERVPTVDPETGAPRDFLEMPIRDAAAIWTRSIEACARRSAWCGLWVSRHFCHLAESAREHREAQSDREAAAVFLAAQQERQSHWRGQIGLDAEAALETAGFRWLRWFDRLSLWLCCGERSVPETLPLPDAGEVHVVPRNVARITLAPFPFRCVEIQLTVSATRLGRQQFNSDDALRAALKAASQDKLSWTLQQ